MWWGLAEDGRLHAVASCDIAPAAERGWTEALCGWRLPVDVELLSGPDGLMCGACHLGATTDLESLDIPTLAPFGQPDEGAWRGSDGGADHHRPDSTR